MTLSKAEIVFHRKHEEVIEKDIRKAALDHDHTQVEALFNEYGNFLERHPEALEAVTRR